MARVRHGGTAPELAVRRLLKTLRITFKTSGKGLPGTPDIVNTDDKWAVFVHGCFWHRHTGCKRATTPKTNRGFWLKKFAQNRVRDKRKVAQLRKLGYTTVVVWQCELDEPSRVARKLLKRLPRNRALGSAVSARESYRLTASGSVIVREVRVENGTTAVTSVSVPAGLKGDPVSLFDQAFLRRTEVPVAHPSGEPVRTVDLFSGCGGLSLGALEACRAIGRPFEPVLAVDASEVSLGVYRRNLHPMWAYAGDIRRVIDGDYRAAPTPKEELLAEFLGRIDLMVAGPPCQGHSDLNNHTRRTDERNKLYERVGRFAEIVRPTNIVVENVRTIVHGKDGSLKRTAERLVELGYAVDTGVVDALELAVPQVRRRHVLLASLNKRLTIDDVLARHRTVAPRTVRWAIEDLAREHRNGIFTRPSRQSDKNRRRIKFLITKGRVDLPNKQRPFCHRDGDHSYKSMYGRLSYDLPAATITGGFGSPGQGRFIHPTQRRTLTPHEAARLQFFPDWFKFSDVATRTALAKMIGNAVPMKLSYAFCLELLL